MIYEANIDTSITYLMFNSVSDGVTHGILLFSTKGTQRSQSDDIALVVWTWQR